MRFFDTCPTVSITALFARTWKQPEFSSTEEWIKEWYIYTYKVILLSHKKEQSNAICRNMDGLKDCHTKSSKSDRERKISYDIAYVWNLKKKMVQMNLFTKQK